MADDFSFKDAAGVTQTGAADDVGGKYYPRVKVVWGADGAVNDASAAAPVPVVQTGTLSVTLSAGTATNEVVGDAAHDAAAAGNPVLIGGYASAAAPSDVSGDGDAVRAWRLRNGAAASVLTAGGALIGGDATNGLDVDVTRVPTDPFGANADAASATGSISAKLRGISTALGVTAFDLGSGTGGSRTLRIFPDTAATYTLAAGSAAIGKLAANSGVDIGDVDVTTVGTITPGTAASSLGKAEDAAHASGDTGVAVWAVQKATPADLAADGDYAAFEVSGGALWVRQASQIVTVTTDVTRQAADTTQYAINDAISDSTSSPTSGGFTLTGCARVSGGSGRITGARFASSNDAGTPLQGELILFNQSVTNINDNVAFAVSDAEVKTCVGKIAFAMEDFGNNGFADVQGLSLDFTCVGSANLRFLMRAKNTYTPVGSEVLTVTLTIVQDG